MAGINRNLHINDLRDKIYEELNSDGYSKTYDDEIVNVLVACLEASRMCNSFWDESYFDSDEFTNEMAYMGNLAKALFLERND